MTKLLLVAATRKEIAQTESFISDSNSDVSVLITGVGMVNTAIELTAQLSSTEQPDLVINAGIAGAFSSNIEIGSVVQVVTDRFSEIGVEEPSKFVPADFIGLMDREQLAFSTSERFQDLKEVTGITVNTVHGNERSIKEVVASLDPDVESMEGAAVAAVCKKFGVRWLQIRAISNLVEPRNTSKWNIPLAINNLNGTLTKLLEERK